MPRTRIDQPTAKLWALLLGLLLVSTQGCQERTATPGEVYALKNNDNSYSVVQVVARSERFVVVRSFGPALLTPPTNIDISKLQVSGRYPFPNERFEAAQKVLLGNHALSAAEQVEFHNFVSRLEDPTSTAPKK